jgi:hypothetical protein
MSILRSAVLSNGNTCGPLRILEIPADKYYLVMRLCFFSPSELPDDWWGSKPSFYTTLNEAGTVQVD